MTSPSTAKLASVIRRTDLLILLTSVLLGLALAAVPILLLKPVAPTTSHATCDRLFASFMHADNIVDLQRANILLSGNDCDLASRTERSIAGQ